MNPEDCVLVGVITRKRDLHYARDDHWYRIPVAQLPHGFYANYVAFFLGSSIVKPQSGGIYYYAAMSGHELRRRRDLLPAEKDHPHANHNYYRIALADLQEKQPPILNPAKRGFAFIYTTGDRFDRAAQIGDLYSQADYYVDRVYYALQRYKIPALRRWDSEKRITGFAAGLQIACQNGLVEISTDPNRGNLYLDMAQPEDRIVATIRAEIARQGGPVMISIPLEGL